MSESKRTSLPPKIQIYISGRKVSGSEDVDGVARHPAYRSAGRGSIIRDRGRGLAERVGDRGM